MSKEPEGKRADLEVIGSEAEEGAKTSTREDPKIRGKDRTKTQGAGASEPGGKLQLDPIRLHVWTRAGTFGWGCIFAGLSVVDSIRDVLDADSVTLGATATALLSVAVAGRFKKEDENDND